MNEFQKRLMDKPSIDNGDGLCVFCGRLYESRHHIVPRSAGGTDGPTVTVCGCGNESGCHGLLHAGKLHLDWNEEKGCWEYRHTSQSMKFEKARELPFWLPVHVKTPFETIGGFR